MNPDEVELACLATAIILGLFVFFVEITRESKHDQHQGD